MDNDNIIAIEPIPIGGGVPINMNMLEKQPDKTGLANFALKKGYQFMQVQCMWWLPYEVSPHLVTSCYEEFFLPPTKTSSLSTYILKVS